MKLLYCIPSLTNCGGTERVLTTRLNYLAEYTKFELYVVTTEKQNRNPFFELHPKIVVIDLDINFNEKMSFVVKLINYKRKLKLYKAKLWSVVHDIKPDIITSLLSHEINFLTDFNDKSVKIGENHFNRHFRYSFVKNNSKNILRHAIAKYRDIELGHKVKSLDVFVTLTQEDASLWTNNVKKYIIPNPLSFVKKYKSEGNTKRIVAAGRLTKEKGFDLLLLAWELVFKVSPDWSLVIYGEGEEYNNLQFIINEKELKNVQIKPFEENISEQFVKSDFFVLSSRFEGFGLVIIEAMECGLPVISFNCKSGPNEIISNGQDGILVNNGDILALASAMTYLINDSNIRFSMSKNAVEKAKVFSLDNIMKKWINLYKNTIQ